MVKKRFSRRRALTWTGCWLALGLGACTVQPAAAPARTSAARSPLLSSWLSLSGAWRLEPQHRLPLAAAVPGARIPFLQPVGVAVRGDIVLVADAAARTVWRLERARDAMSAFAPFVGWSPEQGASLQLGNDFHAWIALPAEHAVALYDARGRELRRWRDEASAPRPVAVAVPHDRSELLVADGASARIVVFDPLGRAVRMLDEGRANPLQSIAAMCFGPRGLYVLDRLAQQVVVLGPRGEVIEVIGEQQLVQPRALAVDAGGRVFVSDDADQRIKVFRGSRLLASTGGAGAGPGRFGRIEAMAVDGNLLYVADSLHARVQVLLVAPPSMEPPEGGL